MNIKNTKTQHNTTQHRKPNRQQHAPMNLAGATKVEIDTNYIQKLNHLQ